MARTGARAVFVSSPTYHGVCCDLEAIVKAGHLGDRIVMWTRPTVPTCASTRFAVSAMESGADICVESSHKIISALTQAAMLHMRGPNIDVRDLESVLLLTRPPALVPADGLADLARRQMSVHGRVLLDRAINLAQEARRAVNRTRGSTAWTPGRGPLRLRSTKLTSSWTGLA